MKFDGTNWVNVGNPGFSTTEVEWINIAFNMVGEPYVSFEDWGYGGKATVMKFDGTNWVNVGNPGFAAGQSAFTSLTFSKTGQPYVAFADEGNFWKCTVMKYDGYNWVNVGLPGFSKGLIICSDLAFSPDGTGYVVYQDLADSNKATVMKYDTTFFGINELQNTRLSLYPNPTTDKITVVTSGLSTTSQLSIIDLNGQEVLTRQITNPKTQIDISNLPSGVYFVRLTNDKTVEVGKIMKN